MDPRREEILSSNVSTLVRHTHQALLNRSEPVVIQRELWLNSVGRKTKQKDVYEKEIRGEGEALTGWEGGN